MSGWITIAGISNGKITRFSELAVGDSGSALHVVHFADGGRVAFDGKRGREFVDYLRRAR